MEETEETEEQGNGPAAIIHPWPYLEKFMTITESDDHTKYRFRCMLCKPKVKFLSTSKTSNTNLRTHMQRIHRNQLARLDEERERAKKRCLPVEKEDRARQPSVSQFFTGGTHISQERFDQLILNFIVQGMHPLHTVDRPEYRELFGEILPSRHLISRRTLGRLLDKKYLNMKSTLVDLLAKQNYLCTTTDAWSSNNRSFLGVSIHWIDEESLQIRSGAVACRRIVGRHTYDVLAEMLDLVHREFNINKKLTLTTTDNGSNFVKAFSVFSDVQKSMQECREEDEDEQGGDEEEVDGPVFIDVTDLLDETQEDTDYSLPPHQRCACHSLNLVATRDSEQALTESDSFKKISRSTLAKCQALWNKQQRSTLASDVIQDKLGCQLITPVLTRWNSTYNAMERLNTCIIKNEQKFHEVCEKLQVPRFRQTEVTFIQEYVKVMMPLAKALDVLQSERMGFLGVLVPTISILLEKMEAMNQESQLHHCSPLIDVVISGIKKRFEYIFEDTRLLKASAAHPMFRLAYVPSHKKAEVVSELKAEVHLLQTQSSRDMQTDDDSQDDGDAVMGFFPSLRLAAQCSSNEVDTYLQSSDTKLAHAFQNLPVMKKVFLKYNTGLPASAACERLFSVGKDIFRPKRNRLSDDTFEKLLLCRVNKQLLSG